MPRCNVSSKQTKKEQESQSTNLVSNETIDKVDGASGHEAEPLEPRSLCSEICQHVTEMNFQMKSLEIANAFLQFKNEKITAKNETLQAELTAAKAALLREVADRESLEDILRQHQNPSSKISGLKECLHQKYKIDKLMEQLYKKKLKTDAAGESTSDVDPSTTTSASTSRPRRTARKNTLYNNDDYELSATAPLLSGTPSEKITIPKPARAPVLSRESSTPATSRKRAAPIQLSSGKSTKKKEVQETEPEREEILYLTIPSVASWLAIIRPLGSDAEVVVSPWVFYLTHPAFRRKKRQSTITVGYSISLGSGEGRK